MGCICYTAALPGAGATVAAQGPFGTSKAPADAAKSGTNANCDSDYIEIPQGFATANPLVRPVGPAALVNIFPKFPKC